MLSIGFGGLIPLAFVGLLRPHVLENLAGRHLPKFWAVIGLAGLSAACLGQMQHQFLDSVAEKYFGQLTDE